MSAFVVSLAVILCGSAAQAQTFKNSTLSGKIMSSFPEEGEVIATMHTPPTGVFILTQFCSNAPYGLRPVIRETVYKYLNCGDLKQGFARLRCPDCGHEYVLAFSLKGRYFCTSCHTKRAVAFAEWLHATILLPVPHRQIESAWVDEGNSYGQYREEASIAADFGT